MSSYYDHTIHAVHHHFHYDNKYIQGNPTRKDIVFIKDFVEHLHKNNVCDESIWYGIEYNWTCVSVSKSMKTIRGLRMNKDKTKGALWVKRMKSEEFFNDKLPRI